MKKIKSWMVIAALIVVVLVVFIAADAMGCTKGKKKSVIEKNLETTFEVNKDGSVVVTYCDSFEEDYYNEDELRGYVNDEINKFNAEKAVDSSNGISLESLKVKDKVATLKLKFANCDDYVLYSADYVNKGRNARLFVGTYDEAVSRGYKFAAGFKKYSNLSDITLEEAVSGENTFVLFTNEGFNMKIDGEVIAIGDNVEKTKGVIRTSDKKENYIIFNIK